ncbi:hypothetical protein FEAC_26950 [Ferrimicrobium acidiphilum DSM 19497]|uniref:Uncharacterized protein n=1 Tax=Ferrimicrobium acidiphilum DSM 19497 TaxID=1121877 RepID=A0A0D8FRF5_9ACTN|nr:hypothetical protein FEAC_26950 [Ferrimicrobium acidiphilum DSM 19497]
MVHENDRYLHGPKERNPYRYHHVNGQPLGLLSLMLVASELLDARGSRLK